MSQAYWIIDRFRAAALVTRAAAGLSCNLSAGATAPTTHLLSLAGQPLAAASGQSNDRWTRAVALIRRLNR